MNIPAIAAAGVDKVWATCDTAFKDVTVNQGPTPAYDVTTGESAATTWTTTTTVRGFKYDADRGDIDTQDKVAMDALLSGQFAKLALRARDLAEAPTPDSNVVIESESWNVRRVETDPTGKLHLLLLIRA